MIKAAGDCNQPLPPAFIEDAPAFPIAVQDRLGGGVYAAIAGADALTRTAKHALGLRLPAKPPVTEGRSPAAAGYAAQEMLALMPTASDHARCRAVYFQSGQLRSLL